MRWKKNIWVCELGRFVDIVVGNRMEGMGRR